jgi:hypothetical protein
VEVSQAGRHEPGAAPARNSVLTICDGEELFHPLLDGGMEVRRLHAAAQVAACQAFRGASPWYTIGDGLKSWYTIGDGS